MRIIDDAEVHTRTDPAALIAACRLALTDLGAGRARQSVKQLLPTERGFFLSLAAVLPRYDIAVGKWASYVPGAAGQSGHSTTTIIASDASTGSPRALLRGMAATTLRTAATTAAIAALLRPQARRIALLGFGRVNEAVVPALRLALPELGEVVAVTRTGSGLVSGIPQLPASAAAEALGSADLVVSATGSSSAVADLDLLRPHALALSLDGVQAWHGVAGAQMLSDHDDPDRPSLARAFAAPERAALDAVRFVDSAGAAVTDAALCAMVLGDAS